ncbi:unnamed protein product [Parascedosporium putredinis]|uniref:Zn(2)-C6 fungal-type domain-containing protein n=1 Tax=Parascedosporium putredinis TaxID=1442378 RepID=A0A9P1MER3_9PEZI|nr:unnamed protein product [Parascedosporium putredinis]CAI8001005.1 unnamed protein product [Parascedosporium putredinis]
MEDSLDPPEGTTSIKDLTPEEASRIIHSHRKVRYGTACWPCRQRKVKCDNQQPCENCVKREHPQLCSYKPNQRASGKNASQSGRAVGRKRTHSPDSSADSGRKENRSWPRNFTTSVDEGDVPEPVRYLGQNSIPVLLREQPGTTNGGDVSDIRQDMRPILGLDTSAPFPLMSTKHLDRLTQEITSELPSDREVMKLFRTYKEVTQPFWGFVIDLDEFEVKLVTYLEERARSMRGAAISPKPVSATWLAILFAILAVGSQYHDSPYHVRTKDSQKYIQVAFHFLRLGNFLLRPTYDSIQVLLLTSFVLLNDMKAEASWAILGLTCRLAQSLGLHRPSPHDVKDVVTPDSKVKETIRRKLWWTCTWHDTLISLSFDRYPVTNIPSCLLPDTADQYTYLEAMYHLTYIICRRLSPDLIAGATYEQIIDIRDSVRELGTKLVPQIQFKDRCRTVKDRLQHFAIQLHLAFTISVACRPALRRDCPFEPQQKEYIANECKANLITTVKMFLSMHQLSVIPTRSWAFTYNGLSSALLLGILVDTKADPEIRQLQGDLIAALSATAAKEQPSPSGGVKKTDKDIELSGPLWRALMALKNIYKHGSITGNSVKREGAESTPSAMSEPAVPALPFTAPL